jgi:undecaprenyl-diphosphatase
MAMKVFFNRPRPEFMSSLVYESSPSYPSGHSMLSTVVYLTLGSLLAHTVTRMRYKCYFMTVALIFTLLVGISRITLGVHYPTDVLAGWSTGCIWAILCWLGIHSLQKQSTLPNINSQYQ